MRKIQKGESPKWFEAWKDNFQCKKGRRATYKEDFPDAERRKLRKELLEEQGYICCYCMKRIDINSSHLEHFWPKSRFKNLDMDYQNMLVSCEGETTGGDHCGHKKDDWYDKDMVIPTDDKIETMFRYALSGGINPAHRGEKEAVEKKMIHEWGLDSFHLERNRKMALAETEIFEMQDYTEEEVWDTIAYYDGRQDGKYIEYCNVIIDVMKREMLQ
ncbi:MAG: TIGR02646 family protein [Lachnospiraceae bacterium]|nr:TIGR02646 family protein [Lachnospiraceae bacterium]